MTSVTAIGVDEESMSSPTRPIVWIRTSPYSRRSSGLSSVGAKKKMRAAYSKSRSLVRRVCADSFRFVPLEEHRQMYALSVKSQVKESAHSPMTKRIGFVL